MKHLVFLILFLSLFKVSISQVSRIDSLHNLIETTKEDSTKAMNYIYLAQEYVNQNRDSSFKYSYLAIELAEKADSYKHIIQAYNICANNFQRIGENDKAMERYNQVLTLARKRNDNKGLAVTLNNIAIIHTGLGDYPKALSMYQEALECEKIIDNKQGIGEAYNNIGVIYYYQQDMDRVFEYFEKSVNIAEEIGDEPGMKRGYNNLGALYNYYKDYDKAMLYYEKSMDLADKQSDLNQKSMALNNMAIVMNSTNRHEEAIKYHEESIALKEQIEDYAGMATSYLNFGTLYYNQKDYKKSEECYKKSIEIGQKYNSLYALKEAYKSIGSLYAITGKHELAYDWTVKQIEVRDSIFNTEKTNAIEEMETKYQTELKNRELVEKDNKLISIEKDKVEAELKVSNRNKWIYGLGGGSLGLFFLGLFVIQKNKRRSEEEKNLAIIHERDQGMKAVINAQEEERSRISKDLHDGIGQQLSGLKMAWQNLSGVLSQSNPDEKNKLNELTQILDESAIEVRNISHQMMPKTLKDIGLSYAIEDMLNKSLKHSDIKHTFESFNADKRFEKNVEISLYRVCQELVNNIIKHSNAKEVSVQLIGNAKSLILIVEDNGIGFDSQSNSEGHGLLNMKSRINTVNGEINLEPSPGSGTVATIRIPIQ